MSHIISSLRFLFCRLSLNFCQTAFQNVNHLARHEQSFARYALHLNIPTFYDTERKGIGKYYWNRRKCWQSAFSHFPRIFFSTLTQKINHHFTAFEFSSANALGLYNAKFLSFGKELTQIENSNAELWIPIL